MMKKSIPMVAFSAIKKALIATVILLASVAVYTLAARHFGAGGVCQRFPAQSNPGVSLILLARQLEVYSGTIKISMMKPKRPRKKR